jgi:hypothetical protein
LSVHDALLPVFALSVVLATILVAGRLVWCAILAVRARNYRIAILSAVSVAGFLALLLAVLFMWFILAVSHMHKDISDTYKVMALTGIPYFLVSFGLWRLASRLHIRARSTVAQQSVPGDAPASWSRPRT